MALLLSSRLTARPRPVHAQPATRLSAPRLLRRRPRYASIRSLLYPLSAINALDLLFRSLERHTGFYRRLANEETLQETTPLRSIIPGDTGKNSEKRGETEKKRPRSCCCPLADSPTHRRVWARVLGSQRSSNIAEYSATASAAVGPRCCELSRPVRPGPSTPPRFFLPLFHLPRPASFSFRPAGSNKSSRFYSPSLGYSL